MDSYSYSCPKNIPHSHEEGPPGATYSVPCFRWEETPKEVSIRLDDLKILLESAMKADREGLLGKKCTENPCPICSALEAAWMLLHKNGVDV